MNKASPRKPLAFGWNSKLRKADDFSSVFRFRRAWRGRAMDVLHCPNGLDHGRLGLIVPKKVLRRAVDRNRVKRILREGFRLSQGCLIGLDVVVRIKSGLDGVTCRSEWDEFARGIMALSTRTEARPAGQDRPARTGT